MAQLPRGLLIVLILWLAWSRPSAASRTESPHSDHWWDAEAYSGIQQSAEQLRRAGDYPALENLYLRGSAQAQHLGNPHAQASYLTALGNTYLFLYRYADALKAYRQAREIARAAGDWEAAGAVAAGLSSIHLLVGDWPAARDAVEEGLEAARRAPRPPYYEAQLKLQRARLNPGRDTASILAAVDAARKQNDVALEAEAWDLLGEALGGARADAAFTEAYRLRLLRAPHLLRLSYWRLGGLRLRQGRVEEAATLTDLAIHASRSTAALSAGTLLHQRGRIRQAQGRPAEALLDFEAAVQSAQRWRAVVPPPARDALAAADVQVDREILGTFVTAAVRTGDPRWVRKALVAVEQNRAASLRHAQGLAGVWRSKLPPAYWKTLTALRGEEARQLYTGERSPLVERLHRELGEVEAAVGLGDSPKIPESFSQSGSLKLFRQGLRSSEVLLTFYTGESESYLWVLTADNLQLYRLPPAEQIGEDVERFQRAVTQHDPSADQLGERLYATLFGQLSARERAQPEWVLSLDGSLFELPFAALRFGGAYLVESHSLRSTPSAAMLGATKYRGAAARSSTTYLGVGDAIYNAADDRMRMRPAVFYSPGQLNRLASSGDEIARSAVRWHGETRLLTGENASRGGFLEALRSHPAAIHLATHVVAPVPDAAQAYLAFSIGAGGQPELLSTSEVATLDVSGSLVVMTGCASGTGEVRPGAGLLGLTRAWLSAGASAVLATAWPIEDTHGGLLPAFYQQLASVSAAEALRRGQAEMIHSGTWQADPAYWAAFHLTGDVR